MGVFNLRRRRATSWSVGLRSMIQMYGRKWMVPLAPELSEATSQLDVQKEYCHCYIIYTHTYSHHVISYLYIYMILQYRHDPCSYMFLILISPAFFPRSEKEHLPPGILISGPWATLRRASLNQAHAAARQHPKQKEVPQLQCHPSWRFFMENLRKTRHIAMHQKLVGGLEPWIFMTFHILGMSSSQLTNS